MDDDEDVGHGDEPAWLLECDEDAVVDGVAKDVVAYERHGEVADGDDDVGRPATWASWTACRAWTGWWLGCPAPRCGPRTRTLRPPARSGS